MLIQTWPYGTVKPCLVADVIETRKSFGIICFADGEPETGYVCLFSMGMTVPSKGERGSLVFTEGGPTGGYWKYVPKAE